jgi:phosphate starvation-inducible membrane PsiE
MRQVKAFLTLLSLIQTTTMITKGLELIRIKISATFTLFTYDLTFFSERKQPKYKMLEEHLESPCWRGLGREKVKMRNCIWESFMKHS